MEQKTQKVRKEKCLLHVMNFRLTEPVDSHFKAFLVSQHCCQWVLDVTDSISPHQRAEGIPNLLPVTK